MNLLCVEVRRLVANLDAEKSAHLGPASGEWVSYEEEEEEEEEEGLGLFCPVLVRLIGVFCATTGRTYDIRVTSSIDSLRDLF